MENYKRLQTRLQNVVGEKQNFEKDLQQEINDNREQEFVANALRGEIHQNKKEIEDLLRYEELAIL